MNIRRVIKRIISEEINRIEETLCEAEQVKCEGTEEWTDAKECITDFISFAEQFNSEFMNLQNVVYKDRKKDFSQLAKNLFGIITQANNCIFKERTYGFKRSELKPKYKKPLGIMYSAKSAMGTSLLSLIMANRSQFRMIRSRLRSDELDRRIIDIIYGGKEIDYYHMPEKLQDILPLCTDVSDNFKMRPEDSVLTDGRPNPNYRKENDTYPSDISNDYMSLIEYLKKYLESLSSKNNKQNTKQRQKAAEDGIRKGYIIPAFGNNTDLPCIIKQRVQGQDAYNAIPNALANTKNDYMLRDKETEDTVWFATYEVKGDSIEFVNSINIEGCEGYVTRNGEVFCMSILEEKVKRIVKQILNELRYGI